MWPFSIRIGYGIMLFVTIIVYNYSTNISVLCTIEHLLSIPLRSSDETPDKCLWEQFP